jgi:glycerol-3-phosphate acyltransferase PlsY
MEVIIAIIISYLLGSIPTAIIAGKLLRKSIFANMAAVMPEQPTFCAFWAGKQR